MIAMATRKLAAVLCCSALLATGCATSTKTSSPQFRQLKAMALSVPDGKVVAAWTLPNDLYLSQYGAQRVGDYLVFGLNGDPDQKLPPSDVRGSFGVIEMNTGRLRMLEAQLPGAWTSVITGRNGYVVSTETRPARTSCTYGPGHCTEWLIAATSLASGSTQVVDRGVTSTESVMIPRVSSGPLGFAWQRPLSTGGTEVMSWHPGLDRPELVGRATGEGQLAGNNVGWYLATMWGHGPTLLDVAKASVIKAPAIEDLISGAGGLAFATPSLSEIEAAPGTVDLYVGQTLGSRLVGHKVAQVQNLYGFAWADSRHLLVATPRGTSLVPTDGGSIIPLPAMPGVTVQASDTGAVIAVLAEDASVGLAVVEAA